MKPCAQCGAVCTDDAVFCTVCGASLTPLSPGSSPAPVAGTVPPTVPPPQGAVPQPPAYPSQPPQGAISQAPAYPSQPNAPAVGTTPPPVQPPQGAVPPPPAYPSQPTVQPPSYGQAYPPATGTTGYGQPSSYTGAPSYGQPPYPYAQVPRKRTAPTVLGIIGIVFGILLPLVTYCCSIPGLVMANQDIRRGLPNQTGRILNIIALAVALANSVFSIFYNSL